MTPQELMNKAIRDYPVGTNFISPHTSTNHREIINTDHAPYDDDQSIISSSGFYICYLGKWGEITHSVQPKQLPIFN